MHQGGGRGKTGGGFNRGGGGGFRGGGRGKGFGPKHFGNSGSGGNVDDQKRVCKNFVFSGKCNFGDRCHFGHQLQLAMSIPAHQKPIKSIACITTPNGPQVLTGSQDCSIKAWNLSTPQQPIQVIPTRGPVTHIEVDGSTVVFACDEPLLEEVPEVVCGMVHLFNSAAGTTVPAKRSNDIPYTHPLSVKSFKAAQANGEAFLITAGGEGNIRIWKYDTPRSTFEHQMLLEGHVRPINSILLVDAYLWSASNDRTIRVWDVSNGSCVGVLSGSNLPNSNRPGHSDSVSYLEFLPAIPNTEVAAMVASTGFDNKLKIWSLNGDLLHTAELQAAVCTMCTFADGLGGDMMLMLGYCDGTIQARSRISMEIVFTIFPDVAGTKAVWGITNLGQNCFGTAGDDGQLIVWQIQQPLK